VDVILHQAALPSVMRSMIDPLTTNDVNINGTLNILMAARDAEVQRVVFASSSSVYGNSTALPKKESMCPAPLSPYAVSKLAAEYYCGVFTTTYGLSTIALRYFNVFGPQQDFASHYSAVIPRFISLMLRGERPFVYGDGHQTRDFTFVENVVTANLLAAEAPKHISGCFNIACGNRISVLRLIIKLNSLLGTALAPQYGPIRPGDVHDSQASVEKAEQILGFVPVVSFDSGLEQTIEYVREIQRGRCLP
jgi:UDP-glucose 4-epimerase